MPKRCSFGATACAFAAAFALASVVTSAEGASGDAQAAKGLAFAKKGDCVKAVPELEQAELTRHRPSTAVALAGCYVAEGDLVRALELYHTVAAEKPARGWKPVDVAAQKTAVKKAKDVDARVPTLTFEVTGAYEDVTVDVDGKRLGDLDTPRRFMPDTKLHLVVRAKGKKPIKDDIVLSEGERRSYAIHFDAAGKAPVEAAEATEGAEGAKDKPARRDDKEAKEAKAAAAADAARGVWLGARFRGVILPKFVQNLVVDGGREMFSPGGGITLTAPVGDVDLTTSLSYLNYSLAETPFKGTSAPDTDWEIDSSTLSALLLEVGIRWSIPLDSARDWNVHIGGGIGLGWMFAGNFYRTQAYPKNGKPGDPYAYLKCRGPNDPAGTFRYCDTLDNDATHYKGYADKNWFQGGLRPLVYPWLVVPEVGLSWRLAPSVAVELSGGTSLVGFVLSGGFSYKL